MYILASDIPFNCLNARNLPFNTPLNKNLSKSCYLVSERQPSQIIHVFSQKVYDLFYLLKESTSLLYFRFNSERLPTESSYITTRPTFY